MFRRAVTSTNAPEYTFGQRRTRMHINFRRTCFSVRMGIGRVLAPRPDMGQGFNPSGHLVTLMRLS